MLGEIFCVLCQNLKGRIMSKPALFTKDFVLLTLANMFYTFGFFLMLPIIPIYVVFRGGTEPQVGMIAASFTIAAIIMRFIVPLLLTNLTKTNMLRIGLIISVVVTASCWFTVSIPSILLVRILQGIGFGAVSTICAALAADLLPDSRRGEGIGYFGMGTTVMVAIAPAAGLFFVNNFDGSNGFGYAFLAASAGQLVSLLLLSRFTPDPSLVNPKPKSDIKESFISKVFDPSLTLQVILLVLFGIARSSEQNYLPLLTLDHGLDIEKLSIYYIIQAMTSFVIKYFSGIIYDKRGHKWTVIPGGLSIIFSLYFLSVADSYLVLYTAAFFMGFGMGCLMPAMQTWTITSVAADKRSVASAAYYNFYDIGQSIDAILIGNLVVTIGYSPSFKVAAIPMVLFIFIYLIGMGIQRSKQTEKSD